MKNLLPLMILLLIGLGSMASCSTSNDNEPGSIYGIVTELGTAEPIRAIGVELYRYGKLLLKTVTFDDGHYEFNDLTPGDYTINIMAEGYEQTSYNVTVEAGRQARADMQAVKVVTNMTVRTRDITDIKGKNATLNGSYSYTHNSYTPTEVGFIYSNINNPIKDGTTIKGEINNNTKEFSVTLNNLATGNYYVVAYAKNSLGYEYGERRTFEISGNPAVTTLEPTNILAETATLNGRIDMEGDPIYSERGFIFSNSHNMPTLNDPTSAATKVTVAGRSTEFSANAASLTENSTYYVRAYVSNVNVTIYGEVLTMIPKAILPSVTTLDVTNILDSSATLNGRIENQGEPAYTERGFVYSSTYTAPTTNDPSSATTKMSVSGTSKEFSINVASLTMGQNYYVRAYATSSKGTSYGEVVSFKPEIPNYVIIDNLMVQKSDLGYTDWYSADALCKNSRIGGYSDWRLPTLDELMLIYNYRDEIGGFSSENYGYSTSEYWTQTQVYSSRYYYVKFYNGEYSSGFDTGRRNARAVRTVK